MTDPLLWVLGLFGATAAMRAKKEQRADFGKDAGTSAIPHYGVLTPARQEFYENAMVSTKSPKAFRDLADDFEKVGLKEEAKQLRARAASREVGLDVHQKRREIVAKCLDSNDPMICEEGADICDRLGMTITAAELRDYARGLREKATLAIVNQPPEQDGTIPLTAGPEGDGAQPPPPPAAAVAAPGAGPAPVQPGMDTPNAGVWENEYEHEYDRAKGWSSEDAFTRHSEK